MKARKKTTSLPEIALGTFSKAEAARIFTLGTRHIHSTDLGTEDPCYKVTCLSLKTSQPQVFPWELRPLKTLALSDSSKREELINKVLEDTGIQPKRNLSERVRCVLEELATNAIYHSYHNPDGQEKYPRRQVAHLTPEETITISYAANAQGVYLMVGDKGGSLCFDTVSSALRRCYGGNKTQIESKEGGAGLGLYMVFDAATHMKIELVEKKSTLISLWLADKASFNKERFSFNYFLRDHK